MRAAPARRRTWVVVVIAALGCGPPSRARDDRDTTSSAATGDDVDDDDDGSTAGREDVATPGRNDDGVTIADPPPPPIAGGTLAMSRDGARVYAADADGDALYVVERSFVPFVVRVELPPGSEPGRVIEDGAGLVHVALRSAGAVATIDPVAGAVLEIRRVCANPRGLGAPTDGGLLVACSDGDMVRLADDGTRVDLDLGVELRDVVSADPPIRVSTYRSPSVLTLADDGSIAKVDVPPVLGTEAGDYPTHATVTAGADGHLVPGEYTVPNTARRAIGLSASHGSRFGSQWVMLHQAAATRTLARAFDGYAAEDCVPVQATALSHLGDDGVVRTTLFEHLSVPVDVAVSADGARAAVVGVSGTVMFVPELSGLRDGVVPPCSAPSSSVDAGDEAVAIAFDPDGLAWVLRRDPAELVVIDPEAQVGQRILHDIELDATPRFDTGHRVFHHPTAFGLVACASCHPEGRDDGMVWTFEGLGPMRTQSLDTALLGSEPLHWRGDLADFADLVADVHDGRMAGGMLDVAAGRALARWIHNRVPPGIWRDELDVAAVERGRARFVALGCATCHAGPRLSNDASVATPRSGVLQVPGLLGVDTRGPWMHDGRAATLEAAIDQMLEMSDPGAPDGLDAAEMDELVAYLGSLGTERSE